MPRRTDGNQKKSAKMASFQTDAQLHIADKARRALEPTCTWWKTTSYRGFILECNIQIIYIYIYICVCVCVCKSVDTPYITNILNYKSYGAAQYSDWLQTGRPGFDPRQRQNDFPSSFCVQTSSGAHPASYPMGTGGPLPGVKRGRGVMLTIHLHLVPRLRINEYYKCYRQLSQYSDWLRTGRPGFDPRQGQNDFSSILCVQTSSGAHPASYPMGTGGPLPGVKRGRGVMLTTHFHLVPRLRMSRSYTSSPSRASMAWSGTALLFFYYTTCFGPTWPSSGAFLDWHVCALGIMYYY
jgi:hypothetical protein